MEYPIKQSVNQIFTQLIIGNRLYPIRDHALFLVPPMEFHRSVPDKGVYVRNILNLSERYLDAVTALSDTQEPLRRLFEKQCLLPDDAVTRALSGLFRELHECVLHAVCRVLVDTDTLLVLEYSDEALTDIRIFAYSFRAAQNSVCVFPAFIHGKTYSLSTGGSVSSDSICEDGIVLSFDGDRACTRLNMALIND